MGTLGIVEAEIVAETGPCIPGVLISFEIHLFVLHRTPQPLYEQVVAVAPFPTHADSDAMLFQESGKGFTGELGALVGVEYVRSALPERFFQRLDAKTGVQGVGKPPGEHITTVPVDDGHKV